MKNIIILTLVLINSALLGQYYKVESFQGEYEELNQYNSLMIENEGFRSWDKRFNLNFQFPFFDLYYDYINCFMVGICYFDDEIDYSMRLLEFGYEPDILRDTININSDIRYKVTSIHNVKVLVIQFTKNRLFSDPTVESHDSHVNFQYWFFENGTIEIHVGPANIKHSPVYVPGEGFYLLTDQGPKPSGPHVAVYHPYDRNKAIIYDDLDSLQNFRLVFNDTLPGSVDWWPPEGWVIRFTNLLVSTDDNPLQGKTYVYPNPTSEKIRISSDHPVRSASLYHVNRTELLQLKGEQISEMDLSAFPPGTYFLRLSDGKHVFNHKIVKI